ncbi:tyrosine--tRNA ligase, mitochondrial [Zootermopsis nevadensis]|uniref:tyrosine--tRNA ligase, mitochondrial n=1 Tax=Zootermopsis nevadensis TaxID=136037 RepID=UPI000B8E3F48|nr:tyrosine--tRNA ligase, mitochondrial [Zootermopsis nevadensis]
MSFLRLWRDSILKCVRYYSNRNILKLHERGMYDDIFPTNSNQEVIDLLNARPQCVYAGFDPTASSLHVGNLLVLINLLHWQRGGHKVIALVGGATGRIGDPSGHTVERPELQSTLVRTNVRSIEENIRQIFTNHEQYLWKKHASSRTLTPAKIVDNLDWYSEQNILEFVSRVGRHFRLGTMLLRHSVQSRLSSEAGMSFTEFCYQVFQAYDWLHLLQRYDCRFQVGGSDQMGNIVSGHELISRVTDIKVYGLTLPLVTTESGHKFGKSAGNAVWLSADKSSPFELYQFFVRCNIMEKHQKSPELRIAQKKLAEQVLLLVHGEEGLEIALKATSALYDQSAKSLLELRAEDIGSMFEGAKVCELLLQPGTTTLDVAMQAGCFASERDAVRIISAGGFYINYQRVTKIDEVLTEAAHILPNNVTLIRVGKKNYYIVKWLK